MPIIRAEPPPVQPPENPVYNWRDAVRGEAPGPGERFFALQVLPRAAPRKNKVIDLKEIDFDKTPIGDVFNTSVNLLNNEIVKAFSVWHPHLFENRYKFKDRGVHIGLEVEVENVLKIDPQLSLCFWSIHEDGSLRNRGREFKTYPMPLQYSEAALKLLFNSLNKDMDFSKRT